MTEPVSRRPINTLPSPDSNATLRPGKARAWIEAMRLRTLPVSLSSVIAALCAGLQYEGHVRVWPLVLCAIFAILAQIASNFSNEYYDYKAGSDKPGRVGPRRGVTEGDISPRSMLLATYITMGLAAAAGLGLVWWGGWWLVAVGVVIGVALLAYSAGPFPLSRHALGEVAVIIFFGIVPVTLTYALSTGSTPGWPVWCLALAIGLLGANVLVVNNYRDMEDDREAHKTTSALLLGKSRTRTLYLLNALIGSLLTVPVYMHLPGGLTDTDGKVYALRLTLAVLIPSAAFAILYLPLWRKLRKLEGSALNPILGATARAMALTTLLLILSLAI